MYSPLDQARETVEQARDILGDGKRLMKLAAQAQGYDPTMAGEMERIALNLLRHGETMLDRARDVERSVSKSL